MKWLKVMLLFVPISLAGHFMGANSTLMFIFTCLAIIPLAGFMGTATEELAKYRGPAVGGLLNATFGNATEMIISLILLQNGQVSVVKASLIGSIVGNILLVLGLSVLLGGVKYKVQAFNKDMAGMHASMMAMSVIGLLVPALFVRNMPGMSESSMNPRVLHLSLAVAAVLFILYFGSLLFSLYTHESLFRVEEDHEPPEWKQSTALWVLLVATIIVAFESEMLVKTIEPVVKQWNVSPLFIGIIVLPIVGNAAEHSAAVMMALRNKMDISLNIAVSSSTQIAMFVAPVVIFISFMFGKPITVLFSNLELISVAVAAGIAVLIALDGKSHWLEGAQLLATYIIIAFAFFFVS